MPPDWIQVLVCYNVSEMGRRRDRSALIADSSRPRRFVQMDMPIARPVSSAFAPRRRFATLVDRVGATASMLCAVHCALLPFVLALLPLIGLEFLAGHTFERVFVTCAALLACASLLTAYRRHRHPHALFLMVPGIALLLIGVAVNLDLHILVHTACVVTGGVLVASAHAVNLVLAHRHHHATCTHATARA